MKKKIVVILVMVFGASAYSQTNRDILNRLDDLDYEQQMRDIQRGAEQQIILIPAPASAVRSNKSQLNFIKEVKTYPDRYRFIERVNPFDYYIYLPIKRFPDGKIYFITVLLSDEILKVGALKYNYIVANANLDCKNKSVKISGGDAYNSTGGLVGTVQDSKISYGRNTKFWSKIDVLYCH